MIKKDRLFKTILIVIMFLLFNNLYASDCDKPKLDKNAKIEEDGGCKLEVSESLVICLMEAKNDKERDLCTQKEKNSNCERIAKKYSKIKNIKSECNIFYSDKKIACLLKKDFDSCKNIDIIKKDKSKKDKSKKDKSKNNKLKK